jgi:hypothetical protein
MGRHTDRMVGHALRRFQAGRRNMTPNPDHRPKTLPITLPSQPSSNETKQDAGAFFTNAK